MFQVSSFTVVALLCLAVNLGNVSTADNKQGALPEMSVLREMLSGLVDKMEVCDAYEHTRAMLQWDQAINDVNYLMSHLTGNKSHAQIGVQFPEPVQSAGCLSQYGSVYAKKYARVFGVLTDPATTARPGCRFCCKCCPNMVGCGVCCDW